METGTRLVAQIISIPPRGRDLLPVTVWRGAVVL